MYGFSTDRVTVAGNEIYRNGLNNPVATSGSYAGIFNDGGTEWTVAGNDIWDDTTAIAAGSWSGATYSFPGKDGSVRTQSYTYHGYERRSQRDRGQLHAVRANAIHGALTDGLGAPRLATNFTPTQIATITLMCGATA